MHQRRSSMAALVCLLLLGGLGAGGCDRAPQPNQLPAQAPAAKPTPTGDQPAATSLEIPVVVDFRNGQPALEGTVQLPADATAFAALQAFAAQSGFEVQSRGTGETIFVIAIRDVANQGAKGDNWTYRVNGQLGDRSAGIYQLKPGDKLAWIFGKYP